VIGVVLTGTLDDGTAGLYTIKLCGGTAIVQEPADAMIRSMPLNALEHTRADYTLPAARIGELIARLVREEAPAPPQLAPDEEEQTRREVKIAEGADALEENVLRFGELSQFTCPECRGVLTMLREGKIVRFRCAGARRGGDAAQSARRGVRCRRQYSRGGAMLRQGARRARAQRRRPARPWKHRAGTRGGRPASRARSDRLARRSIVRTAQPGAVERTGRCCSNRSSTDASE
jgi:CheB methylesterase